MARRSGRNRRVPAGNDARATNGNGNAPRPANGSGNGARPDSPRRDANGNGANSAAPGDRYEKYLPSWMKGANGAPTRPPRPRRARQQRPAGGYTPGKLGASPGDYL